MNDAAKTVEASYAACRQISRRAKSSFYAGFLLLSGARRRAMDALYAFARLTDDIVDGPGPREQRRMLLAGWRHAVEEALGRCREPTGIGVPEKVGSDVPLASVAVLPALADTVERFSIPPEHIEAMLDGAAMDLDHNRYETFDELAEYCRRVASSVGLACVRIWGFRGAEVFPPAEKCGIAMQLTNILRDVREDLARNRVYLPQAELRQHGYTEADLRAGVADARFHRFMTGQIVRARRYYDEGKQILPWLEPNGQRVCGVMMDRYRTLLDAIARRPEAVLHGRVRLGVLTKARLAFHWLRYRAAQK